MKLTEIRRMPTTTSEFARMEGDVDPRIHESVFKSFHIVEKVKELCKRETPYEVIIEIIDDLYSPINEPDRNGGEVSDASL